VSGGEKAARARALSSAMFFDIYCLSTERNAPTVERFLGRFCERERLDPLHEVWLYVMPNEQYGVLEYHEFSPASVAEVITYAVAHPTHCFSFSSQAALRPGITTLHLQFTYDGKVVFGVSIEEMDGYHQAQVITAEITHLTHAYKGYIAVEYPPACDEEEFDADVLMWQNIGEDYR
jgi:hypothetical protein